MGHTVSLSGLYSLYLLQRAIPVVALEKKQMILAHFAHSSHKTVYNKKNAMT
jgi:hypothetical protein